MGISQLSGVKAEVEFCLQYGKCRAANHTQDVKTTKWFAACIALKVHRRLALYCRRVTPPFGDSVTPWDQF